MVWPNLGADPAIGIEGRTAPDSANLAQMGWVISENIPGTGGIKGGLEAAQMNPQPVDVKTVNVLTYRLGVRMISKISAHVSFQLEILGRMTNIPMPNENFKTVRATGVEAQVRLAYHFKGECSGQKVKNVLD